MLMLLRSCTNLLPSLVTRTRFNSTVQGRECSKYVLGCGSNVVDNIYNVKVVPKAGEKGFFMSPFRALEAQLIGGVTLNHLCWAALGGVPTGLLAFQGNDAQGRFIRSKLKAMGVNTEFIKVDNHYITSECHVFIQEDGERSILQAPAASFLINTESAREAFEIPIRNYASMVTTEISQLPFSGVLEILKMAKEAGILSILDLDVPPSVAINEAKLGVMDDLLQCLQMADVLKPAKAAAEEVLQVLGCKIENGDLMTAANQLMENCGSKLVAITDGASGSILATKHDVIKVEATPIDKVIDTTGAGDAFLGGLIVGITELGLPVTSTQLVKIGEIANAFGAAGVQSVGGVPVQSSKSILENYLPQLTFGSSGRSSNLNEFTKSLERDSEAAGRVLVSSFDNKSLTDFMTILENCEGHIFTTGIGKSGHVASRLASSLSSIGLPANYVSANDWQHGDLGKLVPGKDVCILISHSGSTDEVVNASTVVIAKGVTSLAITGKSSSPLDKLCLNHISYEHVKFEEPFTCLPSTSLIVQEMICNAIVCEMIARKGVSVNDFAANHPGGSIGTKLSNER